MAIDKNAITKEAQKFAAKGQFDKAIAEWKKLLKESPNDPNIFNTIGDLCLKKNSKAEAVDAYKRAADLLAEDGFTSKAIALYKKVLNIDNDQIEVHLALGDMNAEKGLTGNALENYKHVADHYTHQKNTVKALGIYQKMADLNPSNVAFRIKLADMYAKQGMKAEATKTYIEAADGHISKEAFKEARQLFEKVLAVDPDNKEVYHKAGIVYFKEGKFAEACKALKPAFESDPTNEELTATYLDALEKAGKTDDTEEVLKTLLDAHPEKIELREKLYAFYLVQKDLIKAIVEASAIADARTALGQTEAAEELLTAFVKGNPQFPHGRRKLAEFYASVNRPADAAKELVEAADILIETGDEKRAKAVLGRALEIVPDLPAARERLDHLVAPAAAPPPPAQEFTVPEPVVEFEPVIEPQPVPAARPALRETPPPAAAAPAALGEDPAVNEALTEADVLIKYGLTAKATEQLETLSSNFPENPRIRIRLRDLYHEQGNIDKAVRHGLLAVALYTKNGMGGEAEEALEATRAIAPDHPAVVAKLGRAAAAAASTAAPAVPEEVIFEAPEAETPVLEAIEPIEILQQETMPGHFGVDMALSEETPQAFEETPPAFEPASAGEIAFDSFEPGEHHLETTAPAEAPFETEQHPVVEEVFAGELEHPAPAAFEEAVEIEPEAPVVEVVEEVLEAAPEAYAYAPAAAAEVDINEIWAEAEFYFQQGLFDEAKKHYAKIIGLTPSDRRAIDRLSEIAREEENVQEFTKLADAVDDLESELTATSPSGEMAMTSSDEEAVRSLMQEIQQLKQKPAPLPLPVDVEIVPPSAPRPAKPVEPEPRKEEVVLAPPPPRKAPPTRKPEPIQEEEIFAPPPPPRKAPPAQEPAPRHAAATAFSKPFVPAPKAEEDDFFDLGAELQAESMAASSKQAKAPKEADDFFDLAAELRDELSSTSVPARPDSVAEEQSLDDIFEEFKKGVEQQAVKEDADTHYNLGVAYKEMALLDDAIAEFILTPEDEPMFIQSRYMLGLCYMEKGEYRNAIGEIQNALDYSEGMDIEVENSIGMHYDLALAYQGAGNNEKALSEFKIVSESDPRYRDTAAKIKGLQKGGAVSIDQVKDDIEKEISSKFLAEGARIEREEKTRKNERVKG